MEAATLADLDTVVRLLAGSDLPVDDVHRHIDAFLLAKWRGEVIGAVGLEHYGEVALLRSLCVAELHRRHRVGRALVAAIEAVAFARGVRNLYLLTMGAASYFERHGYVVVPRDEAPAEIRQTAQFHSLCPSSAVCMRKSSPLSAQ